MAHKLTLVRDARLMPFRGTMDHFASGVFDKNGECLADSLIPGRSEPSALLPAARKLAGPHIFGGYLFGHFGHFTIESLARAYVLRQCPPYPVALMSANRAIAASQRAMFKMLGFHNELVHITEPTAIEQLVMSPAGCVIEPPFVLEEQLEALAVFDTTAEGPNDTKIWLSRAGFDGLGNEPEIEEQLKTMGWVIAHLEELPFAEQVRIVATAGCVAGLDGSAFYTALFAKKVHGTFYIFNRRPVFPAILDLVLSRKGIPHENHSDLPLRDISKQHPVCRFALADPSCITDVLRDA